MRFILCFLLPLLAPAAATAEPFVVHTRDVVDRKAVIATVEPAHLLTARARIGGTIAALAIKEGDVVAAGAEIASVTDAKLALQMQALAARIASQQASRDKAKLDYGRAAELMKRGVDAQTQLDAAKTALDIAERTLSAMTSDRDVIAQQASEGAALAPANARVLSVPVSVGRVVMPGETIATMAEDNYILRLQLPERHAQFLRAGDMVSIGGRGSSDDGATREGRVRVVYPEIEGGRVIADVEVSGLGDYFVGERARVYVDAGARKAILVPAPYIYRRAAVTYVKLEGGDEIVVQPGERRGDNVEILAGLHDGDRIVAP